MRRIATLVMVVLLLTACSPKTTTTTSSASGSTTTAKQVDTALPAFTQLLVGTFELEDTPQAVTADQAATLLPLWKAYRSLSNNSSSSPEEREALQKQIEQSMTAEQRKVIADTQINRDILLAVMQERGLTTAAAARGAAGNATGAGQAGQGQRSAFGGGGMPGLEGGMPPQGGGQGFPGTGGGTVPNPQELQTRQAERGTVGTDLFTTPLVEELIRLLESKRN
jgi:hypothetical protein